MDDIPWKDEDVGKIFRKMIRAAGYEAGQLQLPLEPRDSDFAGPCTHSTDPFGQIERAMTVLFDDAPPHLKEAEVWVAVVAMVSGFAADVAHRNVHGGQSSDEQS